MRNLFELAFQEGTFNLLRGLALINLSKFIVKVN